MKFDSKNLNQKHRTRAIFLDAVRLILENNREGNLI